MDNVTKVTTPHDLATILNTIGDEWINICRDLVTWKFRDTDNGDLIYSPVACDCEETQMGSLLRAFERAYPMLPKMCEAGVTRKKRKAKTRGNEHVDLWFSYQDECSKSVEVYIEGKWTQLDWKDDRFDRCRVWPKQQADHAERQLKEIEFSNNSVRLSHKRVVALFVVFGLPTDAKESREMWNTRIDEFLKETEEESWIKGKDHIQRDFDAGDSWERLRECAPKWEKDVPFCPRARLYLYEVSVEAGA